MKLNQHQVELVSAKVGAEPVAEGTVAHNHLKEHFGDHTFYLGSSGAYVWEMADGSQSPDPKLEAVQLASWANEDRTMLQKEAPTPIGSAVALD